MFIDPKISGLSIVLVGSFNPRIFNADWFVRNEILTDEQIKGAKVEIIHQQITQIEFDFFSLTVQPEKFHASTTQGPFVRLRDIVVKTFKERLSHTPLLKLGINRDVHFDAGTMEIRDKIGHRLAPPEAWGDWGPKIRAGEGLRHGGMLSLTVQVRDLKDREIGHIQATVEPSARVPNSGVFVAVNDHYEVPNPEKVSGAKELMTTLETKFDESILRSDDLINQIMAIRT